MLGLKVIGSNTVGWVILMNLWNVFLNVIVFCYANFWTPHYYNSRAIRKFTPHSMKFCHHLILLKFANSQNPQYWLQTLQLWSLNVDQNASFLTTQAWSITFNHLPLIFIVQQGLKSLLATSNPVFLASQFCHGISATHIHTHKSKERNHAFDRSGILTASAKVVNLYNVRVALCMFKWIAQCERWHMLTFDYLRGWGTTRVRGWNMCF